MDFENVDSFLKKYDESIYKVNFIDETKLNPLKNIKWHQVEVVLDEDNVCLSSQDTCLLPQNDGHPK